MHRDKKSPTRHKSRDELLQELVQTLHMPVQNLTLLDTAFTHTSYANENKHRLVHHSERLEFLGDAVLDLIIGEYLFLQYPHLTEGELTRAKAAIVCEESLATCSRALGFGAYLRLGKGELHSGGRERASLLADTFEAVIGAVYLESDYETTEAFVLQHMGPAFERSKGGFLDEDYKTLLQERIQRSGEKRIVYRLVYDEGPDHDKIFCMEVVVNDQVLGSGIGKSKKEAEQQAACEALKTLQPAMMQEE